jgi:hypothetical protein
MATKKILIQIQVGAKDANIAVANVTKSLEGLSSAQMKVNKVGKQGRAQSGLNNAILLESGRLASDLNYGFTAIANNMGQLVTLFGSFAETNGGVINSFKELGKSLWGMGGILIGVQLLIAFGQDIWDWFKRLIGVTDGLAKSFKNAGQGVSKLAGEFEIYIRTLQDASKSIEEKNIAIRELNKNYPEFIDNIKEAGVSMDDIKNNTYGAIVELKKYREEILKIAMARAAEAAIEKQKEIEITLITARRIKARKEGIKDFDVKEKRFEELLVMEAKHGRLWGKYLTEFMRLKLRTPLGDDYRAIKEAREQIKELMEFVNLTFDDKGDTDEAKRIEIRIGNVNKEIALILKLRDLRNKYAQKTLDLAAKSKQKEIDSKEDMDAFAVAEVASVENKRKLALIELEDLEMSEGLKGQARTNINAYYDALQIENADKRRIALDKINELEAKSKLKMLDDIGKGLMIASNISGKATGVGKALAIAGTLVSTYSAAQLAYQSQMTMTPEAPIRAEIARAVAILQGLANVKAIMAVKTPAMKESSVSGAGAGAISTQAPDFNVVGQGGVNQLGQVISNQFGQPIRAYVVSGDITSAQELDRNITSTVVLG